MLSHGLMPKDVLGTIVVEHKTNNCIGLSPFSPNVRHNLICNKFPGYSLEDSQEVYPNLIALVERCKSFLSKGLPRRDYNQGQEALPTTAYV